MTAKLVETMGIEVSGVPVDVTGTGHTGDRYNLKFYGRIGFLLAQGVWTSATAAVTLQQHTAATAGTSKALSLTKRWSKVALTGPAWIEAPVVADTFNLPSAANTMTLLEVDAEQLDQDNGYTYVSVNVGTPGVAASLLSVVALLPDARYMGAPAVHMPDPKV
jgi:hypothetical protein